MSTYYNDNQNIRRGVFWLTEVKQLQSSGKLYKIGKILLQLQWFILPLTHTCLTKQKHSTKS